MTTSDHPIVFYDGDCGLCHRTVRRVMARDRDRIFRFAPLSGETYARLDHPDRPLDTSSIVVAAGDELYLRSDAALFILRRLGGPSAGIAAVGRWCPRPIRDAVYRFVARHRRRFFGGPEACPLPTESESSVLLP